jgi:hypothetical protein
MLCGRQTAAGRLVVVRAAGRKLVIQAAACSCCAWGSACIMLLHAMRFTLRLLFGTCSKCDNSSSYSVLSQQSLSASYLLPTCACTNDVAPCLHADNAVHQTQLRFSYSQQYDNPLT